MSDPKWATHSVEALSSNLVAELRELAEAHDEFDELRDHQAAERRAADEIERLELAKTSAETALWASREAVERLTAELAEAKQLNSIAIDKQDRLTAELQTKWDDYVQKSGEYLTRAKQAEAERDRLRDERDELARQRDDAIKYRDDEFQLRDALANENARLRAALERANTLACEAANVCGEALHGHEGEALAGAAVETTERRGDMYVSLCGGPAHPHPVGNYRCSVCGIEVRTAENGEVAR